MPQPTKVQNRDKFNTMYLLFNLLLSFSLISKKIDFWTQFLLEVAGDEKRKLYFGIRRDRKLAI